MHFATIVAMINELKHSAALEALREIESESIDLIYTDPPFNTGKVRKSKQGFSFVDNRDDYYEWLKAHVEECHRVLKPTGCMYLHLNEKAAAYARVLVMDPVFGTKNHLNTIIWSFDFGGRGRRKFAAKHDVILAYSKDPKKYIFNWDDIDRIPYLAPELQKDKVRALRGKVPTDVWWMSIIGTAAKERVGWPTQKPVKLIQRAIVASSPVDGLVLDPFAGSGSTAVAAINSGRRFVVIDEHPDAVATMEKRFSSLAIPYLLERRDPNVDDEQLVLPSDNSVVSNSS